MMTVEQKAKIASMRRSGVGYGEIAEAVGTSKEGVRSYCRRNGITANSTGDNLYVLDASDIEGNKAVEMNTAGTATNAADGIYCRNCGKELQHTPGKRRKIFCSKECGLKWWHEHPEMCASGNMINISCPECGLPFRSYKSRGRKYCSHACYIRARFGKGESAV